MQSYTLNSQFNCDWMFEFKVQSVQQAFTASFISFIYIIKDMAENINTSPTKSGFFSNSFFSNVTSSVTAISQTIQAKGIPEMNKRLNELQQKAREIPGQIALLQGDLEHERASFIKQNKNVAAGAHRVTAKGSGKKVEIDNIIKANSKYRACFSLGWI